MLLNNNDGFGNSVTGKCEELVRMLLALLTCWVFTDLLGVGCTFGHNTSTHATSMIVPVVEVA